jgi:sugar lactone lactonase YvrE
MFEIFKRVGDRFFGSGEADTSVPVLDGALKPNNLLDTAEVFLEYPGLEDMVVDSQGRLVVCSGKEVLRVDSKGALQQIAVLPKFVQALARYGEGLVVATSDGLSFVEGEFDSKHVSTFDGQTAKCIIALCENNDGSLLIAQGSCNTDYKDWAADLLNRGNSGRLLSYNPKSGVTQVRAQGLAYCYGVCSDGVRTLVSESWAHRILICKDEKIVSGLSHIPGYPSRIAKASDGGFWLTIFAPRSQLLEFVLREDAFRTEMMQTVDPKYWIAPALNSGKDFLEPLQQGGVRQMGVLKPWAPARSYGLVLRLSPELVPLYSLHSRVGGLHHGIVAALELDGTLLALSKGSGRILRVPLAGLTSQG